MSGEIYAEVDRYLEGELLPDDPVLESSLRESEAAGLPAIQVSPTQGKFLHLLVRAISARKVLEVGTLGGYSAIWMGRALPADGRLVSLELRGAHAAVARRNLLRAGLAEKVEVRVGAALASLAALEGEGAGPFDLVFIDADKPTTTEYYEGAVRLARRGTVVVVDNVVRRGEVADGKSRDENVRGIRRFLAKLGADRRSSATALQTVGRKGHDGFVLAVVEDPTGPA
jgi:predicted O-methyltransferase YrrM